MKMNEYSITVGCGRILKGTRSPIMWTFYFGMIATPVLATTIISSTSDAIMGHAPTVSDIKIEQIDTKAGLQVKAGTQVKTSWKYNDADGDIEKNSLVEWFLDDALHPMHPDGSITLKYDVANKKLKVRITPYSTDTAYPNKGSSVISSEVLIAVNSCTQGTTLVDSKSKDKLSFTCPLTTAKKWSEANHYCKGIKAKLPTRNELQALFLNMTSANRIGERSDDMCALYGWPLGGDLCGGTTSMYWTSDIAAADGHHLVVMSTGSQSYQEDSKLLQVTCVY